MKYILIASALLSSQVFAKDLTLNCFAKSNLIKVFESQVALKDGQTNLTFGGFEGFDFLISSKANNVVELQLLNVEEPSRTYATATLNAAGSFIELSQWKRDYILDVRCDVL